MTKHKFEIKAGPSREEIFDAARLYCEKREVRFTMSEFKDAFPKTMDKKFRIVSQEFIFYVRAIEVAGTDGERWIITLQDSKNALRSPTALFKGYYDSTKRKGWLDPVLSD